MSATTDKDHEAARAVPRRVALAAGAAALAAMASPSLLGAQGARRKGPPPRTGDPSAPDASLDNARDATETWLSPELRLARRITMGLTDADAALARQMGYAAYLEYQLDADQIDDSAEEAYIAARYPRTLFTADQLISQDGGTSYDQLVQATIHRAIFSRRQLKERMVEFWSDHFNISAGIVQNAKLVDDREVVRRYALGSFPDLLFASAHSPAMLSYLDQATSTKDAPNQNYAREIMELHTLGVNGGYTQGDVAELSRVLTGWTVVGRGTFGFSPALHDFGAKTVLGQAIPASTPSSGGLGEGEGIVAMLANHPSTATFIATKLLKFFLRYDPQPSQVAAVAHAYDQTRGDIKAMLRVVLSRDFVMAAPAKLKRPFGLVVSAARALGVDLHDAAPLQAQLAAAGHLPFLWLTPDGYPDTAEYWAGNIVPRWNLADFLSRANSVTTLQFDIAAYMTPATADAIVAKIDRYLFGGEAPDQLRGELRAYVAPNPASEARVREAISLALSSFVFQCY